MSWWWETVVDAIPVVGTGYRAVSAVAAHIAGDHDKAKEQWAEAGMNLAGDALGLVTGGAGKVASTAAKAGAKAAAKAVIKNAVKEGAKVAAKDVMKEAAKEGGKAAARAARKQLTKKGMKKYAKKYIKKKIKKKAKDAMKEAMEASDEEDDDEICVLEELYHFSGCWKGFYKQFGDQHPTECTMVIDQDGNIAGQGSDEVSDYEVSGEIQLDGTFKFNKQYKGPDAHHLVVYTGSLEWTDQPVLQGRWAIPSTHQEDEFVLVAVDIGLEAAVISLTCLSAEEVIAMDHQQKREEIINALSEVVLELSRSQLSSLDDQELINYAEIVTVEELYEDSDDDEN